MRDIIVRPTVAVILAGSGSDGVFVASVFAEPLASLGIRLVAPPPFQDVNARVAAAHARDEAPHDAPGDAAGDAAGGAAGGAAGTALDAGLEAVLHQAVDRAVDLAGAAVLAGGISLGAHVAASWALRHPDRCAGLLLALPGWVGAAGDAPAAVAARASAAAVCRDGLERVLADVHAGIRASGGPQWVAEEVGRAWRGYGDALPGALRAASATSAPTEDELRRLTVPAGVAALSDDPLHPRAVAQRWALALPRAALVTTSLRAMRHDRTVLGRATVLAWLRAAASG